MSLSEKIINGWNVSAKGYSKRVVKNDFIEPGKSVWIDLILSQAPKEGTLKILDVGTGPGVFATILSLAGHEVTGIDISPKMLEEARLNAEACGVSPEFLIMNSQDITFEDSSYDMIVSRYVVWAMEYPERTYENWLRILKPGGRIVVFDGGQPKLTPDEIVTGLDKEKNKAYFERFGEEVPLSYSDANYEEARGWKRELKLTYEARPDWDIHTMEKLGYVNVHSEDVSDKVWYTEKQKFLNEGNVLFRLCGDKPQQ